MPDARPNLSAIVVSYGRSAALLHTLRCLLAQNPPALELIVVDQTEAHPPDCAEQLAEWHRRGAIRWIRQRQAHAQIARNRAILEARGEVLLFVDDDIDCGPELVGAHWRNYVEDPELAAVCGFYLEPGEVEVDRLPAYVARWPAGWIYMPHAYGKRIPCHLLPTCNGSVRRSVALRLGGFDEHYHYTLLDDTDFACRLKATGLPAVHDPTARLRHLKIPSGGKRPGGSHPWIVADRRLWYTWSYFFWRNFGLAGTLELARNFRRTVLRRPLLLRPWWLPRALYEWAAGTGRALVALSRPRRLLGSGSAAEALNRGPSS